MRNALRNYCASSPNRCKIDPRGPRRAFSETNALNERLGSLQVYLGSVPGALLECSWAVLEHPGPSQERSWGVPNASLARSGCVPAVSRGAPESIQGRPDPPRSILNRFWINSGSILAAGGLDGSIYLPTKAPTLSFSMCLFRSSCSVQPASIPHASSQVYK